MSAEVKWAVPKADTIIRDPRTKAILPPVGGFVPWIGPEGRYWRRREREGSIIIFNDKPGGKTEVKVDGGKK
jgi:hypothetical protein